ncbi:MAG: ATPase [Henriciella sp.]
MGVGDNPKRFYKTVAVAPDGDGWAVHLDGRAIKTPAKTSLTIPCQGLAEAIAAEWDAQESELDLASMTLTKLANVAIDRTPGNREAMADELAKYAETDVTCYLAEGPTPLRERQDESWRPWRDWAGKALGIVLVPVEGIVAMPQPQASLDLVRNHALGLDNFRLTALAWGCSLFGSAVLALAVEQGALEAPKALQIASVDEDWQIETWGSDDEAVLARNIRENEARALAAWFTGLNA